MFVVTARNKIINLDHIEEIVVVQNDDHTIRAYCANPGDPNGYPAHVDLVEKCDSEDVAYWHIGNIADAVHNGKSVYVIGTDPSGSLKPSEYICDSE